MNFAADMRPIDGAHDPLRWPRLWRRQVRLLVGHMPFGFASHFPGSSEYVTFVRDPIARSVSEYHFIRNKPDHTAFAIAKRLSLVEFVKGNHGLAQNCYTRWLSNAVFGTQFRTDEDMLQAAICNLSAFSFIGITERFDASVERLCEIYGLSRGATSMQNRNDAAPCNASLSTEELLALERFNSLDLVIYEHCMRRSGTA